MSETKFTPGPWFVDADFYVYGGETAEIERKIKPTRR